MNESHDDRRIALPLHLCQRCGFAFYMDAVICARCGEGWRTVQIVPASKVDARGHLIDGP